MLHINRRILCNDHCVQWDSQGSVYTAGKREHAYAPTFPHRGGDALMHDSLPS